MGTNFYFMMKNKELVQNNFANKTVWSISDQEYEIVDEHGKSTIIKYIGIA